MANELAEMEVPVGPSLALSLESRAAPVAKMQPSAISNQLREELVRILRTGDARSDGAFTVAVATQVEKFAVAAREILMTETLAQGDLNSLMMMRRQPSPYGAYLSNGFSTDFALPSVVNNENFGVQAIRQLVEASRTIGETPAKLVEALVVARENKLTDVVAALEKKLGVSKEGVEAAEGGPTTGGGAPAFGGGVPTLPDGRPLQ